MAVPVLRIEIEELKNSILHLERSNRELKELLQTDPDPEYRLAIGENITTIAKKRARVAALEEELRRLTGESECESDAVAVPVSEAPGASAAATRQGDAAPMTSGAARMQTEEPSAEARAGEEPIASTGTSMEVDAGAGAGTRTGESAGNGGNGDGPAGAAAGAGGTGSSPGGSGASSGPAAAAAATLGREGPAASTGAEGGAGGSGSSTGVWL